MQTFASLLHYAICTTYNSICIRQIGCSQGAYWLFTCGWTGRAAGRVLADVHPHMRTCACLIVCFLHDRIRNPACKDPYSSQGPQGASWTPWTPQLQRPFKTRTRAMLGWRRMACTLPYYLPSERAIVPQASAFVSHTANDLISHE